MNLCKSDLFKPPHWWDAWCYVLGRFHHLSPLCVPLVLAAVQLLALSCVSPISPRNPKGYVFIGCFSQECSRYISPPWWHSAPRTPPPLQSSNSFSLFPHDASWESGVIEYFHLDELNFLDRDLEHFRVILWVMCKEQITKFGQRFYHTLTWCLNEWKVRQCQKRVLVLIWWFFYILFGDCVLLYSPNSWFPAPWFHMLPL